MPQPITELARSTILSGGMEPDKFVVVLVAFGPLPGEGQLELAERLVGAVGVYRLRLTIKRSQPAKERNQLNRIALAAGCLARMLRCRRSASPWHRFGLDPTLHQCKRLALARVLPSRPGTATGSRNARCL